MINAKEKIPLDSQTRSGLLLAARDAAALAYCPFSRFRVGAALLVDGQIFTGCNIENASFSLTVCAERVAILKAISGGFNRFEALAVSCIDAPDSSPIAMRTPCGACRQVIAEFVSNDFLVIVEGVGDFALSQLLPTPFKL